MAEQERQEKAVAQGSCNFRTSYVDGDDIDMSCKILNVTV